MNTSFNPTEVLAALATSVGARHLLTDIADMAPYAQDWRHKYHGRPLAVVRPGSTAEVCAVMRTAAAHGVPVVTQGGNTGLSGGATPDASGRQLVLCTQRLNRVRNVDATNDTIIVEAGVVLQRLQDVARQNGRLFPLALAAQGSCTVGGNLATNAGGTAVLRYGSMRDLTLGLEVVTASGDLWDGLRVLRKDNTGYDLRNLFIGSEGTLGVITAAALKLFPTPRATLTAMMALNSLDDAVALLAQAREALGPSLTAFEVISAPCVSLIARHFPALRWPFDEGHPVATLLEISDHDSEEHARKVLENLLGSAFESGTVLDGVVAESIAQSQALWALRESISEAQGLEGAHIKHDIAIPAGTIAAFVAEATAALERAVPQGRLAWFGHLGDGNLHFNLLAPNGADPQVLVSRQDEINRIVHDLVAHHAGSISAEHGLGVLRRDENQRYKSDVELNLMRTLKLALDPGGLLNPGKVLAQVVR